MKSNQLFIKYVAGLFITKIILMLLILGYTMYAYGYFTVNRVIIIGNKRISKNEIFKRTGLVIGESTTLFLNSTLEKELDKNAWVISSHVEKELPDYIYIEIMEEDIFCLYKEQEDKLKYISKSGKILGDANIQFGLDFPVIIGESNIKPELKLKALELLELSESDDILNFSEISEIQVSSIYGITVNTTYGTIVYFGTGKTLGERWNSLREFILYSQNYNFKQDYIDLSIDNKVVVKYDI